MSTKARLISTISAVCLILALLITGVWAVSTANVTLGGTVSFIADNVNATVTGSITGTQESITLPDLEYKANTDTTSTEFQANVAKWSNNSLTFTSENEITMTITVTNNSTERSLYVKVTDNTTTTNIDKTFSADKVGAKSGQEYELAVSDSITYEITMSVHELNESASATYAYDVVLRDSHYTGSTEAEQTAISYRYTIEDGEVYQTSYCLDCGVEGAKTKMAEDSYIIATPETAQEILDGDINGKTVVFSAGNYENVLEFRPTATNATVYTLNDRSKGDLVEGELDRTTEYYYERKIGSVTLTGVEGAVFKNIIGYNMDIRQNGDSTSFWDMELSDGSYRSYDAVKGLDSEGNFATAKYFVDLTFDDLVFTNMTFEGEDGRLFLDYGSDSKNYTDSITIKNCSFTTNVAEDDYSYKQFGASTYIGSWKQENINKITYLNNYVDGHYQGFYTLNADEIVVSDNIIKNTTHNGIAIKSGQAVSGTVSITNNTINNTGDRAIRFGEFQNATLVIENNTFIDAVDSDNDLLKSEVSTALEYEFKGNTYNGTALETLSGTTTQLVINLSDFDL